MGLATPTSSDSPCPGCAPLSTPAMAASAAWTPGPPRSPCRHRQRHGRVVRAAEPGGRGDGAAPCRGHQPTQLALLASRSDIYSLGIRLGFVLPCSTPSTSAPAGNPPVKPAHVGEASPPPKQGNRFVLSILIFAANSSSPLPRQSPWAAH